MQKSMKEVPELKVPLVMWIEIGELLRRECDDGIILFSTGLIDYCTVQIGWVPSKAVFIKLDKPPERVQIKKIKTQETEKLQAVRSSL